MMKRILSAGLPALLIVACAPVYQQVSTRDLATLSSHETVLVGRLRVFVRGIEQTSNAAIELKGLDGAYRPAGDGTLLWIIPDTNDQPVQLTWLSTAKQAVYYGDNGPVLVPVATRSRSSNGCIYVGEIELRIDDTPTSRQEQRIVGMSGPETEFQLDSREPKTLALVEQQNPSISGLDCVDATIGRRTKTTHVEEAPP